MKVHGTILHKRIIKNQVINKSQNKLITYQWGAPLFSKIKDKTKCFFVCFRDSKPLSLFKKNTLYLTCSPPLKLLFPCSFFSCITPFKIFYIIPFITLPDSQSTVLVHHTNSPWPLPWRYLFPATTYSHLNFDETNQTLIH